MPLILAVLSALALASLDYVLIAVCFLYRPRGAEILVTAMLVGALAAVVLRLRWLLFATQNAVTLLVLVRVIQGWPSLDSEDIVSILVAILLLALGNVLAWLIARVFQQPAGLSQYRKGS